MRRLVFDELQIQNFKAFIEGNQILDLHSYGPGVHFIRGRNLLNTRHRSNGASKTSIWHALCWCLYGSTTNGLHGPDIKPWYGPKETRVSVGFKIDNRRHSVVRSTYPNRLQLDNEVVPQEEIDRMLGIGFEVFINTIVFGQGNPLFFDLPPRHKLELFTNALGLDRWEVRSKLAAEATTDLSMELERIDGRKQALKSQIEQLVDLVKQTEYKHLQWEKDQKLITRDFEVNLTKLQSKFEAVQKHRDEADLKYDSAMTEIVALRKHYKAAADMVMRAQSKHDLEDRYNRESKRRIDELKEQLADLGESDSCPTCGQPLKGTSLLKHKNEVRAQITELRKKLERPPVAVATLNRAKNRLEEVRSHTDKFQVKADAANDAMLRLDPELSDLKASITMLKSAKSKTAEAFSPFYPQLKELKTNQRSMLDSIATLEDNVIKLTRKRARTGFWIKGFKEVRLYVLEEILYDLELACNSMLEEFGLAGWQVKYEIERETKSGNVSRAMNVSILSPQNTHPVRFESWSGGEAQRLRLISALSLADGLLGHAGIECPLVILDEPTRGLEMNGIDDLIECLHDRSAQRGITCFFTDHRALESSRFASTLTVTKDEHGAHL